MTREEMQAVFLTAPTIKGRAAQAKVVNGIEDYLFIGGDKMSARQAAERLGRTERTIQRYRRLLREAS